MPGDRRRRRHRGTHQMSAAALALASLEVAIRRAGASLARRKYVGVHREAHAASGLAPLEAGLGENAIEAEALRLQLDLLRSRHDHSVHARRDMLALDDPRGSLQMVIPCFRARADEHAIDLDVLDSGPRL